MKNTEGRSQAIVALGANIGERWQNICRALERLKETPGVFSVTPSNTYETAPVGMENQPPFLNLVAGVETALSPDELMRRLLEVENELGRRRDMRWGPRTIDLDLLFFERETRDQPGLTIPHPRWNQRPFVMFPLRDLLSLPGFERETWNEIRDQVARLAPDPGIHRWTPPG